MQASFLYPLSLLTAFAASSPKGTPDSLSQSLTALPAPSEREPLALPQTLHFDRKLYRYAKGFLFEERLPPLRGKMSRSDKRGNLSPQVTERARTVKFVAAVPFHDPFREKAILENPQIFQNCEIKIILPLNMPKAKRRAFLIVPLPKKAAAQTCAAAFHLILPVQPCKLPHRPRSCRSGSVPRHGRSRIRGAAGRDRAPWRGSPAGWAGG